MSYAVEGGGSKTCSKAKRWLYEWPEASHRLLQMLTDLNVDYLVEQARAGAQMLQVFESNAEYLTEELFRKFSLPYLSEIAKRVKERLRKENIEPVPMVSLKGCMKIASDSLCQSYASSFHSNRPYFRKAATTP